MNVVGPWGERPRVAGALRWIRERSVPLVLIGSGEKGALPGPFKRWVRSRLVGLAPAGETWQDGETGGKGGVGKTGTLRAGMVRLGADAIFGLAHWSGVGAQVR